MNDVVTMPPGACDPEFHRWEPWTPSEAVEVLAGVAAPWYIAAGWAISLFLGEEHRHHDDLEVGVPAARFDEVTPALSGYDLFVAGGINNEGMVWPLRGAEKTLDDHHQTWVRERQTRRWRMDLFREPSTDGMWVCRRNPAIRRQYGDVIAHTKDGIPYACPEVVMLFKAKRQLPKDEGDFDAVEPLLGDDARTWLAQSIALIHPGHDWLKQLQ